MRYLYNFAIRLYVLFIHLAAFRNAKAAEWVSGRRNYWIPLKAAIPFDKPVVWFHAASLGEFEQGRSLIEAFRASHKSSFILLTFFSPSGYNIHKNYPHADYVTYMPPDTPKLAYRFIRIVHPEIAFFIKYEFWFNHLSLLHRSCCRTILISGIFRPEQHFFKPWGAWFQTQLKNFEHFFLQDRQSADLLEKIGLLNVTVAGDTRFDRVSSICANAPSHDLIARFAENRKLIIGGSTWPEDENALLQIKLHFPELFFIIAPHEVHESRIQQIEQLFSGETQRLSKIETEGNEINSKVLIIDSIGKLSGLYRYAWFALIGGGFGKGIHNTLEAACFGLPVAFGPNYHKFREAVDLIEIKAAKSFIKADDLFPLLRKMLDDEQFYKSCSDASAGYVGSKTGATQAILEFLTGGRGN